MSVSLSKNQTVSLKKESGAKVTKLHVGLGWDPAKAKGFFGKLFSKDEIDLDASCILLDANGKVLDTVWFRQLKSKCGAVQHSGDNLTGEGEGDDEIIYIDMTKLQPQVNFIAFTVNSFRGQTFNEVENAFVRILDQNNKELAIFNLNDKGAHTGVFIASMKKEQDDWIFKAQGIVAEGSTFEALIDDVARIAIK